LWLITNFIYKPKNKAKKVWVSFLLPTNHPFSILNAYIQVFLRLILEVITMVLSEEDWEWEDSDEEDEDEDW
jgi:hypothetical protein